MLTETTDHGDPSRLVGSLVDDEHSGVLTLSHAAAVCTLKHKKGMPVVFIT